MQLKKVLLLFTACALFVGILPASAAVTEKDIDVTYRGISLYIDQEAVDLYDADGNYVEPFIYADTTYLPLRAVAEALQMQVDWDQETYSVYLSETSEAQPERPQAEAPQKNNGTTTISVTYNNISVYLNDEKLTLAAADGTPVEPFIANGTTYLPLRAIAEATDSSVEWDNETSSIYIETQEELPTEPPYDVGANSDWSLDEAESYGYTVDMDAYADNGYALVTAYNGTQTAVLVPAKIGGKTTYITQVALNEEQNTIVFSYDDTIESVTFETGVQCENAANLFRECANLKYVYNLPDSTSGPYLFSKSPNMRYIDKIPEKITDMESFCANCPEMSALKTIPSGVTNTGHLFANCTALTGDIYCEATNITWAFNMLHGTVLPITLHVPYPSTSYTTIENAGLPENVQLVKTENQIAYLPKEIYVSTFLTLNLYNYAVSPNYSDCTFTWDCAIGEATQKGYALKGTDDQLGDYPLTLTISRGDEVLSTLSSTVRLVSPRTMQQRMRLLTIGDTSTFNSEVWMRKINTYTDRISFVGSRTGGHEGRLHYSAGMYLQPFTYTGYDTGLNQENPFYNPETERFDWNYYKQYTGISPTAVQLFFGTTDLSDPVTNVDNMKKIVDAIRQDDPDMPIFIASAPYFNGANKTIDTNIFHLMLEQDRVFSEYENLYFVPIALTYDRDLNYNPSSRSNPNNAGYEQFGMCMFSAFAAYLQ